MEDDFQYMEFELDSNDATVGLNGESTKDWPKFMLGRRLQNISALKILEVQLPTSYYIFQSGYNSIQFVSSDYSTSVTIPPGNYSLSEFLLLFQQLLNAIDPNNVFSVYASLQTNKISVSWVSSTYNMLQGIFYSTDSVVQNALGLSSSSSTSNGTHSYTFPKPYNFSGPLYLYCNSSTVGSQCDVYLPNNSSTFNGNVTPILAKIPITANTGSIVYWKDPCPEKWFDLEDLYNISEIDFYFTYPGSQRITRFSGMGFSIKLGLLVKSDTHTTTRSSDFITRRVVKRTKIK